jgi:hypothetical protein
MAEGCIAVAACQEGDRGLVGSLRHVVSLERGILQHRSAEAPARVLRASALRTLSDMAGGWRLQLLLVRSVSRGYLLCTTDAVAFGGGCCFTRSLHYPPESPSKCADDVCDADLLLIDA